MKLSTLVAFEVMLSAIRRNEGHCAVDDYSHKLPHICMVALLEIILNKSQTTRNGTYFILFVVSYPFQLAAKLALRRWAKKVKIFANFVVLSHVRFVHHSLRRYWTLF